MELLPYLLELQCLGGSDIDAAFASFVISREAAGHPVRLMRTRRLKSTRSQMMFLFARPQLPRAEFLRPSSPPASTGPLYLQPRKPLSPVDSSLSSTRPGHGWWKVIKKEKDRSEESDLGVSDSYQTRGRSI
jgi:hypothetical protein